MPKMNRKTKNAQNKNPAIKLSIKIINKKKKVVFKEPISSVEKISSVIPGLSDLNHAMTKNEENI